MANLPASSAHSAPWDTAVNKGVLRYIVPGVVILFVAVFGFGHWASTAPLSSAVAAPGNFVATGQNKVVQHLEGGIVKSILISEGDSVVAGQTLIVLDDTQARAEMEIIETRISAITEEIDGLAALRASTAEQIKLLESEVKDSEALLKKGLTGKPRVLELQRLLVSLKGQNADYLARMGQAKQRIAETEERMIAAKDVLKRVEITAPVTGVIVKLLVHSPGAVIKAGEPVLDLLPTEEQLLVEAQIRPTDIASVYTGLQAQVRLTALNQRLVPTINGTLIYVSADALRQRDDVFYLARVRIEPDQLRDDFRITPGMPAEVYIQTGERTFFEYIMAPIANSLQRSFLEN